MHFPHYVDKTVLANDIGKSWKKFHAYMHWNCGKMRQHLASHYLNRSIKLLTEDDVRELIY